MFNAHINEVLRASISQFLRSILTNNVPVETGMAKAALRPIARFLRQEVVIQATRLPYHSSLYGTIQTQEAGESRSHFAVFTGEGGVYGFEWDLQVIHYYVARFYNGRHVPGNSLIKAALDDFEEVFNREIRSRMPNPGFHMQLTPVGS